MGPLGDNLTVADGAALLVYAYRHGVTVWDTADDYGTHAHIARALGQVPRERIVLCTKTRRPDAIPELLAELGAGYLDVLLLHEVEADHLDAAHGILERWHGGKQAGAVRAYGLSTHSVRVAREAAGWGAVDVLMLPANDQGLLAAGQPLPDGDSRAMLKAAHLAAIRGKGVIGMKLLAGGALAGDAAEVIRKAARLPFLHALCIGMRSRAEVDANQMILHPPAPEPEPEGGHPTLRD